MILVQDIKYKKVSLKVLGINLVQYYYSISSSSLIENYYDGGSHTVSFKARYDDGDYDLKDLSYGEGWSDRPIRDISLV
jgi:arginine decarboxylase-like protein